MIYLHVPFCRSFCTYCSFYSELACKGKDAAVLEGSGSVPRKGKGQVSFEEWADEVCREILSRRTEIAATLDLNTLYIGGGTPSVLPLSILRRIVETLQEVTGCGPASEGAPSLPVGNAPLYAGRYKEFTIEVNPEDIVERGPEYVQGLFSLGVNRISMGVQSLDDGILRWMNRRHSADGAREAYRILTAASAASSSSPTSQTASPAVPSTLSPSTLSPSVTPAPIGSSAHIGPLSPVVSGPRIQISIDLITGVPGMSLETLNRSLDEVLEWHPSHISSYQLGIDEGSALAEMIDSGKVQELSDEECRAQYELVCRRLREAGYHHYEISNWALPGCEAVHNSAYWTRHPYVGLGPGAHSLSITSLGEIRSWNSQTLSGWTSSSETLTPEEIREERIMLGLRTDKGAEVEGRHIVIPEKDWFIADDIISDLI